MKNTPKKVLPILKILFKETFLISLNVFVIFSFLGFLGFAYLYLNTPLGQSLFTRAIAQTSIIYDRTGEHVLYAIHQEENRKIISHNEIPDTIRIATIAAEDANFYSHHGIDLLSVLRAIKTDVINRNASQGASTITQQLARNAFLSREKTLKRKLLEAVYALKIERKHSKEQILDSYLNEVPYGSNAYGIETAAETYFNKSAIDLTLDEAALLAALTKATTFYSPYGLHTTALIKRQQEILERIAQLQLVDPSAVAVAMEIDTLKKIVPFSQKIEAPHFVFYVLDQLEQKYGSEMIEEGGLKIYTTLDYDKQKLAEKIIQESSDYNLKRFGASNTALVAVDPKTGQILTMVGSKGYFDPSIDGEVNVTIRPRQPGSSFKPFAYAKAFEMGYQPETLILDEQTNFGVDGSGKMYVPNNYDGKFHGVVSMRQALAMSLNIPAVKTLRAVGIDATIELAHRLGITTLNDRNRYGLSLVIGGGEVTLLDETAGFSVFANDGARNPIDPILKIQDNTGKVIQEAESKNLPALDPQVARRINSILSDNVARTPIFGPNNKLFIPGRTVAAKTGTTQEFRDAWTVGYTPSIAVGVWTGNNDSRSMRAGADGSYVAAPIWNKFMTEILKSSPDEKFIDYEKKAIDPKLAKNSLPTEGKIKITYYRIKGDKKISEEKAKKMDPEKVKTRFEFTVNDEKTKTEISGYNTTLPAF